LTPHPAGAAFPLLFSYRMEKYFPAQKKNLTAQKITNGYAEKKINCAGNCKPLQEMNVQKAYLYLKQYGGLDYLYENWWALHTDNPFWAIRDMLEICRQNGGQK